MFFKNRLYRKKVLVVVKDWMVLYLNPERGEETLGGLCQFTIKMFDRRGDSFSNLMKEYRKLGLSHDEAALSFIDGAVGEMKHVSRFLMREGNQEGAAVMRELINSCEMVIDEVMRVAPGRILPRHGRFAEAAEQSGLATFFKE